MKLVAIIVAHPDDVALWAAGTIISNQHWNYFVVSLCRGTDKDWSQRFYAALNMFRVNGIMGNLNDEPEQEPMKKKVVEDLIMDLLPSKQYDLVITYNPAGAFASHLRHEETAAAVINLWQAKKILTRKLWTFACEDGNTKCYPVKSITIVRALTKKLLQKKRSIITTSFGYIKNSLKAHVSLKNETFLQFTNAALAMQWLNRF